VVFLPEALSAVLLPTLAEIVDPVHVMLAKPAFQSRLSVEVMVSVPVYSVLAGLVRVCAVALPTEAISAAAVIRASPMILRYFISIFLADAKGRR
jgi:hypothetical protein